MPNRLPSVIYANDTDQVSSDPSYLQQLDAGGINRVYEEYLAIPTDDGKLEFLKQLTPELLEALQGYLKTVLDEMSKTHVLTEAAMFADFSNDLGVDLDMGTYFLSDSGRRTTDEDAPWHQVQPIDPMNVSFSKFSHGNPNDPSGHDDIVHATDVHENVFGDIEREENRVNRDSAYLAFENELRNNGR